MAFVHLRVQYTGQLRTVAGCGEEQIELPDGSSVADLLTHLAGTVRREAAPYLLTAAGQLQPSLLVAVNNGAVTTSDAGNVRVQPGDVVTLMPPIGGG